MPAATRPPAVMLLLLILFSASATGPRSARTAAPTALDSLVASERAFAAMSVSSGMRDAFLAYLADDGMIFRPFAANGKQVWEARKPSPATLTWEPAFAEISAAGDLGYTTGPWEFRPPPDSTGQVAADRIGYGHFISVWKKQPDGAWRVAVDLGTSHDKPGEGVGQSKFVAGPVHRAGPAPAATASPITEAERDFSKLSESQGVSAAAAKYAARDVRWNRGGEPPQLGLDAARKMAARDTGTVRWRADAQGIARSGDLGYAYGVAERFPAGSTAPADTSVYLHIWRYDRDGWKLALAVVNPVRR